MNPAVPMPLNHPMGENHSLCYTKLCGFWREMPTSNGEMHLPQCWGDVRGLMKKVFSGGGFTLIELIMVIVILGILVAAAVPRFMDLSASAQSAATDAIAASLSSASSMNAAACKVKNAGALPSITTCAGAAALLEGGVLPNGYAIGGTAPTCTVTHTATSTIANWPLTPTAAACL